MTGHARRRLQKRITEFDLSFGEAVRRAEAARRLAQKRGLGDCLISIAQSDRHIAAEDGSNGDMLCIILRSYRVVTVMLRRSEQGDLNELKLYELKGV